MKGYVETSWVHGWPASPGLGNLAGDAYKVCKGAH